MILLVPEPIVLEDQQPAVDPGLVGISYSGAGSYVVVELGIARAFIETGVRPAVIAGVSSGAITGTAHALDPDGGRGIEVAAEMISTVSNRTLGLDWDQIAGRVVLERTHLAGLGDLSPLRDLIRQAYERLGLHDVTLGTFAPPAHPRLRVAATDRVQGTSVWFPAEMPIEDALLASAAIPGVFPWADLRVAGRDRVLVDGGVITNQPISELALQGCGTIFAVAAGYAGGTLPPPTNALNNAIGSVLLMMHQTSKLEEAYVRLRTGAQVLHVHPQVEFPIHQFDFSPEAVRRVMDDATQQTLQWLATRGY